MSTPANRDELNLKALYRRWLLLGLFGGARLYLGHRRRARLQLMLVTAGWPLALVFVAVVVVTWLLPGAYDTGGAVRLTAFFALLLTTAALAALGVAWWLVDGLLLPRALRNAANRDEK